MINSPLTRAQLLFHQSRFDLAEAEVRRVLGEMPHDASAHALLALCLVRQEKLDDAQQEAEQAIVLAPDWAYPHYCRSIVLEHRNRLAEAEAAAREAIQLEPLDPDYSAQLAATLFRQQKWQAAYDACLEGLSHDAEHKACNHLRTMALTKLGRQSEAVASVDASLQRDPDDAMAHTNKGWALLHQRKHREALEHFREALRIDPTYEYAKAGIVEALKARNPIYRWMLAYFLWMARLSPRARWGVILGGYFAYQFLRSVARSNPELAPWLMPLIAGYVIFALLTWYAYPLFNLALRINKFGRYALTRDQLLGSNWFGICMLVFGVAFVAYIVWDLTWAFGVAIVAIGMALPLVTIFQCSQGWPRRSMTYYAAGLALLGAGTIVCDLMNLQAAATLVIAFILGAIATPWVANYLATATATR